MHTRPTIGPMSTRPRHVRPAVRRPILRSERGLSACPNGLLSSPSGAAPSTIEPLAWPKGGPSSPHDAGPSPPPLRPRFTPPWSFHGATTAPSGWPPPLPARSPACPRPSASAPTGSTASRSGSADELTRLTPHAVPDCQPSPAPRLPAAIRSRHFVDSAHRTAPTACHSEIDQTDRFLLAAALPSLCRRL